ncbi:unnamed protein product [Sphacelaria rigidula]
MKTTCSAIAVLAMVGCAHGFVATVPLSKSAARATSTTRAAERINTMVDQESAKVVTMETVESGAKKVYCRCWKSGTFPLCNGAHVEHNKATGDNVGPLIVSGPKEN